MSIPIYKAELDLGLEESISKSNSCAYYSLVQKSQHADIFLNTFKAVAAKKNYSLELDGLYPVDSILVSTVWNKNDDVFDKVEAWMARNSPVDKPTNMNHDQKIIVGHMIHSTVIDNDGNLIADDTPIDSLPDLYHIVDSAVIYAKFDDKDMQKIVYDLIHNIEDGKIYVSMECFFRNFDYAIQQENGEIVYLERSEGTAFLTKHLRIYGGSGEFQGRKIGRVLRGITFIGRGYVTEPANPASVILSKDEEKCHSVASYKELKSISGVCNNNENGENEMSQELQDQVNELNGKLEAALAQVNELSEQIGSLTNTKTELETQVLSLNEKNTVLARENEDYKIEKINFERASLLVEAGYSKEEAQAKVNAFAALTSDQFAVVANELVEAKKMSMTKEDKTKCGKTKCNTTEAADKLPEVEPEPVVTPVADVSTASIRSLISEALEAMRK